MNKHYLFLGPLYPPDTETHIAKKKKSFGSTAPNVFQWNLIHGLQHFLGDRLRIINALPVGTWPNEYQDLFLKDKDWTFQGISGHEVGCLNLPFFKQFFRAIKTRQYLKKAAVENTEVIIYSAYMPFLRSAYHLKKNIPVTAIITDLPEFYDLGQVSCLRKLLRKIQNKMIYKYLSRIDRFVVLTEQMLDPLRVGNRPWLRMEGICDSHIPMATETPSETKAILYSGTLHYQYGIKTLMDAFSKISSPNLSLWICGSGEAEAEIRSLSEKDPRIQFFGFCTQQQVADLRAKASILINPRPNEGSYTKYSFPSKTMEYMASGKPVIMYKLDGIPSEYDPYLFYSDPASGAEGLKNTIIRVLENHEAALQTAQKAQSFVLSEKCSVAQAKNFLNWINK